MGPDVGPDVGPDIQLAQDVVEAADRGGIQEVTLPDGRLVLVCTPGDIDEINAALRNPEVLAALRETANDYRNGLGGDFEL